MIALPAMNKANYDPRISTGLIAASGTLGILLPPSIMLIVLGDQLRVPVGELFIGAIGPGLLLVGLYVVYLIAIAIFQPHRMPPSEHEAAPDMMVATLRLLRDLIAPILLVTAVLGTIIIGIATPTEAAAIGAVGALMLAAISRKLDLETLRTSLRDTTKTTAMIIFVMIGATIFSVIFRRLGGDAMVIDAFSALGTGPYFVLAVHPGLLLGLGRDHTRCRTACRARCCQSRFRDAARPDPRLVCDRPCGQHADIVPDSAIRLRAVLPARGGRKHLDRHDLSRHHPVRRAAIADADSCDSVSANQPLAAGLPRQVGRCQQRPDLSCEATKRASPAHAPHGMEAV
jgi:hypothetical protein